MYIIGQVLLLLNQITPLTKALNCHCRLLFHIAGSVISFVQLVSSLLQALFAVFVCVQYALLLQTKDSNFRQSLCSSECYPILFHSPFPLFPWYDSYQQNILPLSVNLRSRVCRASKFSALGVRKCRRCQRMHS